MTIENSTHSQALLRYWKDATKYAMEQLEGMAASVLFLVPRKTSKLTSTNAIQKNLLNLAYQNTPWKVSSITARLRL
jgi:hypothetical protein